MNAGGLENGMLENDRRGDLWSLSNLGVFDLANVRCASILITTRYKKTLAILAGITDNTCMVKEKHIMTELEQAVATAKVVVRRPLKRVTPEQAKANNEAALAALAISAQRNYRGKRT